jgi:hypothetical protein
MLILRPFIRTQSRHYSGQAIEPKEQSTLKDAQLQGAFSALRPFSLRATRQWFSHTQAGDYSKEKTENSRGER